MAIVYLLIAGAIGALIKEVLADNTLSLPSKVDHSLCLGSIGGIIIGACAGYIVDGSIETAFLGGYAGTGIITGLVNKTFVKATNPVETPETKENKIVKPTETKKIWTKESIEVMIREKATSMGVDPNLAVAVAKCESGLNPTARHTNAPDSIDRGLYQWNNKYHPEITDEMADDPEIATQKFCEAVKAGHIGWWSASKPNWEKMI